MLRLGPQSKRDEAIYNKLVSVSVLCRGNNRFVSKQTCQKSEANFKFQAWTSFLDDGRQARNQSYAGLRIPKPSLRKTK